MKKKKANLSRIAGKMRRGAFKAVEEYLAHAPEPGLGTLRKMRAAIRSAVPRDSEEVLS